MFWFLTLAAAIGGTWWYLSGSYEAALAGAKRHCKVMDVQFLDGSVIRNGFGMRRNSAGSLTLVQKFRFEFSTTGERRYSGFAEMLGKRILSMELEAHKIEESE